MWPLILIGVGAVILYEWSKSSSSTPWAQSPTNPQSSTYIPPEWGTTPVGPGPGQVPAPEPGAFGVQPNGIPPNSPAGSVTTTNGLVSVHHTGYSDAYTGAPIVSDTYGNSYLQ
jgi:hypothetical protein